MVHRVSKRSPIAKVYRSAWRGLNTRCSNGKWFHLRTKSKCKTYENIEIQFTSEEFSAYCRDNKDHILSLSRPSVDRIDKTRHYTLDNIQFMELADNIRKDSVISDGINCTCYRCGLEKLLEEFTVDRRRGNGRTTCCKLCDNLRKRRSRANS